MNRIAIIIPTLNPTKQLEEYVDSLLQAGFRHMIVVNDGSDIVYKQIFDNLEKKDGVIVLNHAINMGKGRALKDAFNYYLSYMTNECRGIITVDSDGQHHIQDVLELSENLIKLIENEQEAERKKLILGVRNFAQDVPLKSKFGNRMTCLVMKMLYGGNISDTQTGLRGMTNELMKEILLLKGERFEYETMMLIYALQKKIEIMEIPIKTIYINDNSETHFRPIQDSASIYFFIASTFFKYIFSSLSASIIDLLVFQFLLLLFSKDNMGVNVTIATIIARIISSIYNFSINKKIVFKSSKKVQALFKYYILCISQMIVSALMVSFIFNITHWYAVVIKMVVDSILFLCSYQIQRIWVFKE